MMNSKPNMNPLPDHRSQSVMGYPSSINGYSTGSGKVPPPPPPANAAYPLPYRSGSGYPLPYHGYPNTPETANMKNYASQSFNMWYNSDKYGAGQWTAEPSNSQKFARLMFATMVTLLISLCMVSLVVWLLFGTDVPEVKLKSLSVSNFKTNGSMIEANWTVNVTIVNPDADRRIRSGAIESTIMYKHYPLGITTFEPTYREVLDERGLNRIILYFNMDHEKSFCKDGMAQEIDMAIKNDGYLLINLRLVFGTKFTQVYGTYWNRESLQIFCEDLKLLMKRDGSGIVEDDKFRECLMYR